MKKFFAIILLFLISCSLFFASGCGGDKKDSQNTDSVRYKRIITIGLDDEYAPFGFRDDSGQLVGFDIDMAKEAAKRMGVEFEFKPIDWNNKEIELNSGHIDIIWNGLDITPERQRHILYSKPYMDNRQVLLVKLGADTNFYSEYDLEGKIVGTQAGSNSETYIDQNKKLKDSFKEFKTYSTFKQAFADLREEQVEVLIVDELAARYEMNKIPKQFEVIELTIGPVTKIGIGFRKNDTELRDKVQKAFDSMVKDGTAKQISVKWFQADLIKSGR